MIISFEQTPEEFHRLAVLARNKGELGKALGYCERAISGKGSNEYKMTLADILFRMGRHYDAMDVALALIAAGERSTEIYELMARLTGVTGKLYESVYYLTEKARQDGDDAALDALDEMMEEMSEYAEPGQKENNLFVVGEEPPKDYTEELDHALQLMHAGNYEDAVALAFGVKPNSEFYVDAMDIVLKCYVKMGKTAALAPLAEKVVEKDPQDAFALYVLVGLCKDKSYLPQLEALGDDAHDLYYAAAAADAIREYPLAKRFAARLLKEAPYAPEAFFVAAGVHFNAHDRAKGVEILRDLFAMYKKYPAAVILDGLKRKRRLDVMFGGQMPTVVQTILREYVRKHADTVEDFVRSMATDVDFRRALVLLCQADDEEVIGNTVSFMRQANKREIDRFFDAMLLRASLSPMTKREILADRLLNKHRGRITVVPSAVPVRVNCVKPENYADYPRVLQEAYVDALSFAVCVMNVRAPKELTEYIEKYYRGYPALCRYTEAEFTVALICLLLPEPPAPFPNDVCDYVTDKIFNLTKKEAARVRHLMEIIDVIE